jgi:hypothetical protein
MAMFETLARVMTASQDTLKIHCDGCGQRAVWTRQEAFDRLGPDCSPYTVRRKLICKKCGGRERVTDALIDALIDKETFENRKLTLLAERRGLIDELERPAEGTQAERLLEKFEQANVAYVGLVSAEPGEIRESLRMTTSNIVLQGKCLEITPRFPYADIAKWRLRQLGGAYRDALRTNGSVCRTQKLPEPEIAAPGLTFFRRFSVSLNADQNEAADVLPAAA